jgi:hypothetical protein
MAVPPVAIDPDRNGERMRPGLFFVGLSAVLIFTYVLLVDDLGTLGKFLLQAALVILLLASATWFRYARRRSGWLFFGDDESGEPEKRKPSDSDESDDELRKAS